MYLLFRNENELKYGHPPSHTGKLGAPGVTDIIKNIRSPVEPFTDIVDNEFERYNEDIQLNIDPFSQLGNYEVEEIGNERQGVDLENESEQGSDISSAHVDFCSTQITSDDMINNNNRSLNNMQQQVFDVTHKWFRDYVKSRSVKFPSKLFLFYFFLAGGGGVGKPHIPLKLFIWLLQSF